MEKITCSEYTLGRHFVGRLPYGKDILTSIETFCIDSSIRMATFSLIGAVSSVTLGAYDQEQKVYVTFTKEMPLEIVHCTGNISLKDGNPFVHAHISLADEEGNEFGGHLFSDTTIFAGEISVQELIGPSLERKQDGITGLMLWKM